MFDALVHGRVPTGEYTWDVSMADIEQLNTWAMEGRMDVTKLSFAAWLRVRDTYDLLSAGAAFGHGYGPLLIARTPLSEEQIIHGSIAIPGELTTANLLLSLRYPKAKRRVPMVFSDIENAVLSGHVTAGVIIHENRFTYAAKGLVRILDLGEYWEAETGLPIPLGAIAARRSLGGEMIGTLSGYVRSSVQMAIDQPDIPMDFVRRYAQEMSEEVMRAHIDTYVNNYSVDLGDKGREAITMLQLRAAEAGLI